jgi:tRNA pseudouridine32 synthase/23S rRNA pseudouridine746 synthase
LEKSKFLSFKTDISGIQIPDTFTFPFCYEPHRLSKIASKELQDLLEKPDLWEEEFGLSVKNPDVLLNGKMFGVLVVQKENKELGYLVGFSGKLIESNHYKKFVPPIFDRLEKEGHYILEEEKLISLNLEIEDLENQKDYLESKENLKINKQKLEDFFHFEKEKHRISRNERRALRKEAKNIWEEEKYNSLAKEHAVLSMKAKYYLKDLERKTEEKIQSFENVVDSFEKIIEEKKNYRKAKSTQLQQWLFTQYNFLNAKGDLKNVLPIFDDFAGILPPAGTGECVAPKLLQYAYQNDLKPICMAEFWWGRSLSSAIRKHKNFYPSCRGKCQPVLGYMMEGLEIDDNPLLFNPAEGKTLTTVYEDDHLLVVNKPSEFLSVPGKTIQDSVFARIEQKYPLATGPLLVHRLDMSTSGLLLIAKSKEVHKKLQNQFLKRTISKRYIALLDGDLKEDKGEIKLPLRVDLDDRPRQLVCYEHGKRAETKYEVLERKDGKTRVYFYPITGRTHQLRVHAAHETGLNAPIVGDDLYGKRDRRLHLHAEYLKFYHPIYKKDIEVQIDPDF